MEQEPRRTKKPVDPIAQLERWDRRRAMIRLLMGTAISGVLGYATYPWVAGDRRGELADGVRSIWRQLQEDENAAVGMEDVTEARTMPMALDMAGREYEQFIARIGLRHISSMEVLQPHFKTRGTVSNGLPPRDLWTSIAPTLRVADELRQRLGVRLVTIASAYRSPAYNAMCPGAAAHSYHMRNMALDLVFDCPPMEVVKAAETLRKSGFFSGGIGRYPGFTHVDTRGQTADWG